MAFLKQWFDYVGTGIFLDVGEEGWYVDSAREHVKSFHVKAILIIAMLHVTFFHSA